MKHRSRATANRVAAPGCAALCRALCYGERQESGMAADEKGVPAGAKEKLIQSKERWACEGRLLTGRSARPEEERLPPGQRRVETWPVLDLGVQPHVAAEEWRLTVDGLVEQPVAWDWPAFRAQPSFHDVSDIHCVTQWSRFDNAWEGVSAKHLLGLVRPKPEARFVVLHSYDDYTTNLPLADFDDEDVLLAHSWQGRPLPREHGGPVRAIVPKLYFWKSAKWLRRIEFIAADRQGFWEERGYHDRGDPWREERYG
jgi:DMSO/TMAO reductase YedYZ molybdopterin-dependent catalytic subunit